MKRLAMLLCLLCVLTLLPLGALADQEYFLPSDTREITEAELWEWDRESLSFMFNEIFARHGFRFETGGKFYNWFNSQIWYQNLEKVDDQTAYLRTTELEWKNYHTIRKVIEDMEKANHPYRKPADSLLKSWTDLTAPGNWTLTGFQHVNTSAQVTLEVYSAPSKASWRGANGRAMMSTAGAVWAAGWENGWLQVFYEVNNGGVRVGYVDGSQWGTKPLAGINLAFARLDAKLLADCVITDDPLAQSSIIGTLAQGTAVRYLTTAVNQNGQVWDYVETAINGQTVRGYIRAGFVEVPAEPLPEEVSISAQ